MSQLANVDIWTINLNTKPVLTDLEILSSDEQTRYHRFVTQELKDKYLRAHSAKRKILAAYLKVLPDKVKLIENEHGKPAIQNSDWQFNLSHSGSQCLLAVVKNYAVGIDIERITRPVDALEISQRFFTADEHDYILAADDEGAAFFKLWVRKEAVVKVLGEGLARSLHSFSVVHDIAPNGFAIDWFGENPLPNFMSQEINVGAGYVAAIVVATSNATINFRHLLELAG